VQRDSGVVGVTKTTIDERGFLRRIAVVYTDVKHHHWFSVMRSNEKHISHGTGQMASFLTYRAKGAVNPLNPSFITV